MLTTTTPPPLTHFAAPLRAPLRLSPKSASVATTICDHYGNTEIGTNANDTAALETRDIRNGDVPGGRLLPRVRRNAIVPPDVPFASEAMSIPTKTTHERDGGRLDVDASRVRRNAVVLLPGWDTCDINHVEARIGSPNAADGEVGGWALARPLHGGSSWDPSPPPTAFTVLCRLNRPPIHQYRH